MGDKERKRCGMLGHEFVMSDDASMSATAMSKLFIEHMDKAFESGHQENDLQCLKHRSYNETIDVSYRLSCYSKWIWFIVEIYVEVL